MKISIVTISYNQAPFLEQAIRSVVGQDHRELEYIVVDPGSTDGSRDIIERYRPDISSVVYKPDHGPADGLNKGFSLATGEVFGFINADDVLLPGALRKVADYFGENPEMDIVCGCGFVIDESGRATARKTPTRLSKRLYAYGAVTFFQQGVFFRKSAYRATQGFNPENRSCWDGELVLDMLINGGRAGILHQDLGAFRIHGASISGSGRLDGIYRQDCRRLFVKAMGREMNVADRMLGKIFRLEKWLMNPGATVARALSALRGG